MPAFHPFDPIIFPDSKVLILGTFPSLDSFGNGFYYAHKRNQFWTILSTIFGVTLKTNDDKIALLRANQIALWDVIASCERRNSADTNLKAIVPNDFDVLLSHYPSIERIVFTGQKAAAIYHKHFGHLLIETTTLPSPSPAYAAMRLEKKITIYQNYFC
ncbi:MAG: hypothetical protein KU28_01505 [Sulfurovum sp. PC08-66]|nr:MAG: hypothetical protein KU28_01505 [Sulfurovum sp. PC08-66]KIM12619.1 MAG: hypothetical protein KU37_01620 [Sulfuricurvum sp. PC08-66]